MDLDPLVVLANEPAAYRSLLASELPFLRPDLRVMEINPADLEATVKTFRPSVVVCSRSFEHVRVAEATILLLRAEAVDSVIHSRDETISILDSRTSCEPSTERYRPENLTPRPASLPSFHMPSR